MTDFLVVDESHTFMLNDALVIEQVIAFLSNGQFDGTQDTLAPAEY